MLELIANTVGRTLFMFVLILVVLRLSGRRGVRQLTLFEVAIILAMGSAAGDPMFQQEVSIWIGGLVLFTILLIYKLITWATSKYRLIHKIMEGSEMIVVRDGVFDLKHENDTDFSKEEFFSELRNLSIEHLGQVRMAVLEIDGSLSVLYYSEEDTKYGLPLFPDKYKSLQLATADPVSCMYCGYTQDQLISPHMECKRCKRDSWCIALKTYRMT